jgi:hypothetical protein
MAWDEWEQLKSEAARRRSTSMELNSADGGAGAAGGDLVAYQDDLGAVGHDAFVLYDRLSKGTDIAGAGMDKGGAGSTMRAAASLASRGFEMGGALQLTVEVWSNQAKTVLQACAHISNHLAYSKRSHTRDDAEIGATLRGRDGTAVSVSRISKYFE